jgi:hypothetical protein
MDRTAEEAEMIVQAETLRALGNPQKEVARKLGVTYKKAGELMVAGVKLASAQTRGMSQFANDAALVGEIRERLDVFKKRLRETALNIVEAADTQVMAALPEAKAKDAAQISEIYAERLGRLEHDDDLSARDSDPDNPKVLTIINNIIGLDVARE